ncbi:2-phosphosulfolactate phosphatase [Halanaerobaculum tunisiense]
MELDVVFSADKITDSAITGKVTVVIDVLRATSTIVTALANDALEVLPVVSIQEANLLASKLDQEYLVAGERQGVKIDYFDLGNSPCDYTADQVADKRVVLTTTNGTKCFARLDEANEVLIASLLNLEAVVARLQQESEVVFCCAGVEGQFALDDFVTAGKAISYLSSIQQTTLSDRAQAACDFYDYNQDQILTVLKESASGQNLISLGKEKDVEFIANSPEMDILPVYKNDRIKIQ